VKLRRSRGLSSQNSESDTKKPFAARKKGLVLGLGEGGGIKTTHCNEEEEDKTSGSNKENGREGNKVGSITDSSNRGLYLLI